MKPETFTFPSTCMYLNHFAVAGEHLTDAVPLWKAKWCKIQQKYCNHNQHFISHSTDQFDINQHLRSRSTKYIHHVQHQEWHSTEF